MNIFQKKYIGIICIIGVLFCICLADCFMRMWKTDEKENGNNEKSEAILHADFLNERAAEFCNEYMRVTHCQMEYEIVETEPAGAEITYYAVDENGHITVWKEKLAFYVEDGEYCITESDMQYYDCIYDVEQFYEAYPNGMINNTRIDYVTNGLGEELNKKAKENPEMFYELFEPISAAGYLLNLTEDEELLEITTSTNDETGVVQVSLRLGRDSLAQYAFVQMIQPFGKDGIWVPQTLEGEFEYKKKMLRIYTADLNHDGELEEIDISFNGSDQDTSENVEDRMAYGALTGQVEVLGDLNRSDSLNNSNNLNNLNSADSLDGSNVIYEMNFGSTCFGNGQLLLVRKDGKDYLLESYINEQMGEGNYSYEVFYFENGEKKVVDAYSITFAEAEDVIEKHKENGTLYLLRQDAVPQFKGHIEKWFEDAFILVCADMNNDNHQAVYISNAKKRYEPDEYYKYVWKRNTEPQRIFKADFVEGMDVHIMEIAWLDGLTYEIEALVEQAIESEASPDWGIRILFGNEQDYLYFYESRSIGGMNPFMGSEEMLETLRVNGKELVLGRLNDRIVGSYAIASGCGIVFNLNEEIWNENEPVIRFLIESVNTKEDFIIQNHIRGDEGSYDELLKMYEELMHENKKE